MKNNQKKITIGILTWNHRELVQKCLGESFARMALPRKSIEIIVVDNYSTENGMIEMLDNWQKSGIIDRAIFRKKNIGVEAFEDAFKNGKGELFCILGCDIIPPKKWDKILYKTYKKLNKQYPLGYLGYDMYWASGSPSFAISHGNGEPYTIFKVGGIKILIHNRQMSKYLVSSACRAISHEAYIKTGGMPNYFYGTDRYCCEQSILKGYYNGIIMNHIALHLGKSNSEENKFKYNYLTKNVILPEELGGKPEMWNGK